MGVLHIFYHLVTMRSAPQAKQLTVILLGGLITLQGCVAWTPLSSLFQRGALTQATVPSKTVLNEKPSRIDHDSDKREEHFDPTDESRRNLFAAALASANFGLINTVLGTNNAANALGGYSGMDPSEAKRIDIFEKVSPSVVFIDTFTERQDVFTTNVMEVPLGTGSGFVWDQEGHIVTNFHVVRDAKFAQVAILTKNSNKNGSGAMKEMPRLAMLPEQQQASQNPFESPPPTSDVLPYTSMRPSSEASRSTYKARVVGVDPSKDIAILKVDAPKSELFPIVVGTSTGLRVGQSALAIGNPFGLDHTLTSGIISGLGREVRSPIGRPISNVIQTDCAINPGNSGGPLLDSSGKLIGMNTAIYSPSGSSSGIGFAIPADTIKFITETLIRDGQGKHFSSFDWLAGVLCVCVFTKLFVLFFPPLACTNESILLIFTNKVVRPVLGISYLGSKQAKALGIQNGVLVLDVPEGSPAYKAGLRGTRRTEAGLIELGDILSKVADTIINTESDLFRALEKYKPGDIIKLSINRVRLNEEGDVTLATIELEVPLQSSVDFERKLNLYKAPSSKLEPVPLPQ